MCGVVAFVAHYFSQTGNSIWVASVTMIALVLMFANVFAVLFPPRKQSESVRYETYVRSKSRRQPPAQPLNLRRITERPWIDIGDDLLSWQERLALARELEPDWHWKREPLFPDAGISNYASRYTEINKRLREAGAVAENGIIKPSYRWFFTTPTPPDLPQEKG